MPTKNKLWSGLLAGLVGLPLIAHGTESAISVSVHSERRPDRLACSYLLLNGGSQPIVSFAVGGNVDLSGPYELPAPPLKDGSPAVPGWDASLLPGADGSSYAMEWQAREYEQAVMAGKSMAFDLAFSTSSGIHCDNAHWTAISRESEVLSGMLDKRP